MKDATLGYVSAAKRGQGDGLLAQIARQLQAEGIAVAGVAQINTEFAPDRPCHMDLTVLGSDQVIRISQNLGRHSSGCRLDAAGLEEAVAKVEAALDQGNVRLLIVNKFGKQEGEGRGFRPVIGRALAQGIPVLTAVKDINLPAFEQFCAGYAAALPSDPQSVLDWCHRVMDEQATASPLLLD
jgi:hypothetical protein